MKALIIKLLTAVIFLLSAASCGRNIEDKFAFNSVKVTDFKGSIATIELGIENTSRHNVTLRDGTISLASSGSEIATIELVEEVVVKKRERELIVSRWHVKTSGLLGGVMLLSKLSNPEDISVNYRLKAKVGVINRTFSAENIDLSNFISTFAE